VNNCRTILRQASAWILKADLPDQEKQELLSRIAFAVWAFPRSLRRHLLSEYEDETSFVTDVIATLPEPFASDLIKSKRHRPSRALFELSTAINELPIEIFRRQGMDESVSELCNAMGGCDRIYSTPKTKFYTRHTSRFMFVWLLFLPLALWEPMSASWNHISILFVTTLLSFAILGIEELAIQLEEPFSILPLKEITDGIGKSAIEHAQWEMQSRDNNQVSSEHIDLSGWNSAWDILEGSDSFITDQTPFRYQNTTVYAASNWDDLSSLSAKGEPMQKSPSASDLRTVERVEKQVRSNAQASFDVAFSDLNAIQQVKDEVMKKIRSDLNIQPETGKSSEKSYSRWSPNKNIGQATQSQSENQRQQSRVEKPMQIYEKEDQRVEELKLEIQRQTDVERRLKKSYAPWRPEKSN